MEILCMEILCIPFRAQKILCCAQEIMCMGDFVHGNFVHAISCTKILFCAQEITCTGDFEHGNFVHGNFLTPIQYMDIDCAGDFIEVHDGSDGSARKIGHFCGTVDSARVNSTGNQMYVKLTTDGSNQQEGFEAKFNAIETAAGKSICLSIRIFGTFSTVLINYLIRLHVN